MTILESPLIVACSYILYPVWRKDSLPEVNDLSIYLEARKRVAMKKIVVSSVILVKNF